MRPVLDILNEYIEANREQTRSNVCIALAAVGTHEAARKLMEMGKADPSTAVRQTAATELLAMPKEILTETVRRLHAGLLSGEELLRSFELLQLMANLSEVPLARSVRNWPRRVLDTLRINWRLRTSRTSPFFVFRQIPLLPFLGAVFLSALVVVLFYTFAVTGGELEGAFSDIVVSSYYFAFLLWPVMIAATPPRLAYLGEEAPFADVVWLSLFGAAVFLIVLLFGYLPRRSNVVEDLGFMPAALVFLLFVIVPVAAARIGVAVGALPYGRFWYLVTAILAGLGTTALAMIAIVFAVEMARLGGVVDRPADASLLSIFGISGAIFLSAYLGFVGKQIEEPTGQSRRRTARIVRFIFLGVAFVVVTGLVSVSPWRAWDLWNGGSISTGLRLSDKPRQEVLELDNGETVQLDATSRGKIDLELSGPGDVVLVFGSETVNDSIDPERKVSQIPPGTYPVSGYYSVGTNLVTPEDFLWMLADRIKIWTGRRLGRSPWPGSPLHLSVGWTPDLT